LSSRCASHAWGPRGSTSICAARFRCPTPGARRPAPTIFCRRRGAVVGFGEIHRDAAPEPRLPVMERGAPLGRDGGREIGDQRMHAAHDLQAPGAAAGNLSEGEPEKIVPRRRRHQEPKRTAITVHAANLEAPAAEAHQEVVDLIECLRCTSPDHVRQSGCARRTHARPASIPRPCPRWPRRLRRWRLPPAPGQCG
jgi:hypothetical protein